MPYCPAFRQVDHPGRTVASMSNDFLQTLTDSNIDPATITPDQWVMVTQAALTGASLTVPLGEGRTLSISPNGAYVSCDYAEAFNGVVVEVNTYLGDDNKGGEVTVHRSGESRFLSFIGSLKEPEVINVSTGNFSEAVLRSIGGGYYELHNQPGIMCPVNVAKHGIQDIGTVVAVLAWIDVII